MHKTFLEEFYDRYMGSSEENMGNLEQGARYSRRGLLALGLLIVIVGLMPVSTASVQQGSADRVAHVRTSYLAELGVPHGGGLSLSPLARLFLVIEPAPGSPPGNGPSKLQLIDQFDGLVDSIPAVTPTTGLINLTYDGQMRRWFLIDAKTGMIVDIGSDSHGRPDPVTVKRYRVPGLDIQDSAGLAFDSNRGRLVILDRAGPALLTADVSGWPARPGDISRIDLSRTGLADLQGVAFDPTSGHYHLYEPARQMLHEVSDEALLVASRDLSGLAIGDLQGILFAPSADRTDDPSQYNLYLVDGQSPGAFVPSPDQSGDELTGDEAAVNPGRLVEASLVEPPAPAAADFISTLVQTINAYQWSPPSPDSAGVVYLADSDTLLVTDSEVNEMPIFEGVNQFESSLTGALLDTFSSTSFSNEPTGVAINPANQHLFYTDDNAREVFEIDPGLDGQYDTVDDIVTSFGTQVFGSGDPEGITFDTWSGDLFIADGVNAEIYRVSDGANGIFDGVPPAGDDQVTSFDTNILGITDPEGVAFNPDKGTLYVVGKQAGTLFEVTTGGALVQMIDISAANGKALAGLAYAPGSDNPNEMRIYIAARGVDNNSDPNENDGKVYEMTLPPSDPLPPAANDDTTSTGENTPITIDVLANDTDPNGNLEPSSTNTTCAGCSAPINGTLDNNGDGTFTYTPDAGFLGDDSFVYEICDTSALCDTALVSIAVGASSLEIRVAASTDDAEEQAGGSVDLDSSDLELIMASSAQTVGIRFNGIDVPPGSIISQAYIQFKTDETDSETTNLTIEGEDIDNAATFSTAIGNVSARTRTTASVAWAPAPWDSVGAAGPDQRTPDISAIIQEIVSRPGWASGNSLAVIISGNGVRTAEAYDGEQAGAPLLHVEYSSGGNLPPVPVISAPADGASFIEGDPITFAGSASDDEDGDLTSSMVWESSLDGAVGVGGSFSRSDLSLGVHIITASATDSGGITASDSVSVNIVSDSPVLVGAGDIAYCTGQVDEATADLLDAIPGTVFALGDNANPIGSAADYANCYDPSWGRHKARTRPTPGNHDYDTPGASGYYDYFGPAAGDPTKGYYSYDIADWHIIVLNSECGDVGGCEIASPQGQWLQAELAAHQNSCVLAYWHRPLFSSALPDVAGQDFWTLLYQYGADVVLNGHAHVYERFAPQDPNGIADPEHGIREFVAGTGGGHTSFGEIVPNSEVRSESPGVLKLTLNPASYDWEFIAIPGETFTDSGSGPCVSPAPPNNPPDALDDAASADEDASVNINVLANDTDADGDSLTVTLATQPTNGSAVVESDDTITYTPTANFNGPDSFTYTIGDGNGGSDTATVTVTVNGVNDAPAANDDTAGTPEDTAVNIDVLANDTDVDGDSLAVTSTTQPANGSVVVETDDTITYTPDINFNGPDSFTYTIGDGNGGSDAATVTVIVSSTNNFPDALDDSATIDEDTGVTIDVLANDTDVDGDSLAVTSATQPTNGSVVVESDDTITYTPDADFNGTDSFTYTIGDGNGGSDTATVTITVNAVNDAPVANDDTAGTPEDTAVNIDVLVNDTDVDGDILAVTSAMQPANGSVVVESDDTITYTPDAGFTGMDSFTYTIGDGNGGSDTATVTVTVSSSTVDIWANSDLSVVGSVSGSYLDTHADDNIVEAITEQHSGGSKTNRSDSLAHKWTFIVPPGGMAVFHINAWISEGGDDGLFIFSYSTDDVTYVPWFTVSSTDPDNYQVEMGPGSGTIYVQVNDVAQIPGNFALDTISIDEMHFTVGTAENISPIASFTYDSLGLDLILTDTSVDPDGSITSWHWDFGDDTTSAEQSPTHHYAAAGSYDVILTVTDDQGATDSHTQQVTVTDASALSLTATGYKIKGVQKADLEWTGGITTNIEIYRGGQLIDTVPNDGFYTDHIDLKGGGTYDYMVCEPGGGNCSNIATVAF